MKLHNIKQLERFEDIREDKIIKLPNCTYVLETDRTSNHDKEKKVVRKIEKSFILLYLLL
jgi:hypothetical protein